MVVALVVGWSCGLAGLVYGFTLLQILAIDLISGFFVFALILGLRGDVWGLGWVGARNEPVFASGHFRNWVRSREDLIDLETKAPTKPANWMQVSHDQLVVDRGRCLVLADTSIPQSRRSAYDLSQIGFDIDMCDDSETVMGMLRDGLDDCPWSLLVVDLDFLTAEIGVREAVDDLQSLRMSMKSLSVIILSNEISRDSSDTSRLTIADVSLVAPVSLKRLRRGVWDAQSNNVIWQGRVQDAESPR